MLSYRHAYHAGNFADLLKHIVQIEILRYMQLKDKPFEYIDTHAGAGLYKLESESADKNKEYLSGIGHYYPDMSSAPEALDGYLKLIHKHNAKGRLQFYPGSPLVAEHFLRKQDKAWLFEMHPSDYEILSKQFASTKQIRVRKADGFKELQALLPCQSRRAFVLIDPPYEIKQDYKRVVDSVIKAHRKMANTTFAIWYPVVERKRIERLQRDFEDSGIKRIVRFELGVEKDSYQHGMTSAGMIVINPPWTLFEAMGKVLPKLAEKLSNDGELHYICDEWVGE